MSKFDDLATQLVDSAWLPREDSVPSVVYHYTTAAGLEGALRSQEIWATDCRFLNDLTESSLGVNYARQFARTSYYNSKAESERTFYKTLRELLKEEREANFIFSTSERADDLTQWRTYANEGQGFTIGLDAQAIRQCACHPDATFGFSQVSYNTNTHQIRVRKAIREFRILIGDSVNDEEVLADCCENLDVVISTYSAGYKHSSFRSEREWRINTFADEDDKIKVRVRGDHLIPYLPIKMEHCVDGKLPIREIGIGPGFRETQIGFAVQKLCEMHGVEAKIYNADTPFRRV